MTKDTPLFGRRPLTSADPEEEARRLDAYRRTQSDGAAARVLGIPKKAFESWRVRRGLLNRYRGPRNGWPPGGKARPPWSKVVVSCAGCGRGLALTGYRRHWEAKLRARFEGPGQTHKDLAFRAERNP